LKLFSSFLAHGNCEMGDPLLERLFHPHKRDEVFGWKNLSYDLLTDGAQREELIILIIEPCALEIPDCQFCS